MTEFGTCDKVEALDQLRQTKGSLVIVLRSSSAELLIMLVTVSCILRGFFLLCIQIVKIIALHVNLHALSGIGQII